jgi:hypothetical protein
MQKKNLTCWRRCRTTTGDVRDPHTVRRPRPRRGTLRRQTRRARARPPPPEWRCSGSTGGCGPFCHHGPLSSRRRTWSASPATCSSPRDCCGSCTWTRTAPPPFPCRSTRRFQTPDRQITQQIQTVEMKKLTISSILALLHKIVVSLTLILRL